MPDQHQMPTIVLVRGDGERALTPAETERVLAAFPAVRREAVKWPRMFQRRGGRLLLIDPQIIEEIVDYLKCGAG